MSEVDRSSNQKEEYGQKALISIVPGLIGLILGAVFVGYKSMFSGLGWVLILMGLAAIGYGVSQILNMKKIVSFPVQCPFCKHKNHFTVEPHSDVRCEGCQRSIPIMQGRILLVEQVRCGFCNHLNYYSEKSTGLICEQCNRVVPIAHDGETKASATFEHFTIQDDDRPYDLILSGGSASNEDLVSTLQHMLALNRQQVRQMFDELPVTLLTGVPRKKAELLQAQIEMHHGQSEYKVSS